MTRRRPGRWIAMVAGILAVVYVCAFGFFAFAMRRPPMQFAGVMSHVGPVPFLLFPFESMWKQARRGTLQPGDTAPDFNLPLLGGAEKVELSSFRGKRPVVLIFGSYT
ncbi:MAG: hypothetical protein WBW33_29380 [Bryobacteraceae bacterium]